MSFEPLLYRSHSTLVRLWRRVRSVEDAHFVEKNDGDAAALAFTDFRAKAAEEGFDVLPGDVCAGRVREDSFQCSLMRALHG